jgi:cyclophilin family peptidyl-prolyl cis-trans isomerase
MPESLEEQPRQHFFTALLIMSAIGALYVALFHGPEITTKTQSEAVQVSRPAPQPIVQPTVQPIERPTIESKMAPVLKPWDSNVAGSKSGQGTHVRIQTTKGTFEVLLFPKIAPKTVKRFLELATSGFYDGTSFHRVIPGFVAQGGDPISKTAPAGDPRIGSGGSGKNLTDEFNLRAKHLTGSLAMAHSGAANSGSSQFYVCYRPLPELDGKYCVFGQVTKGMDVIQRFNPTVRDGVPAEGIEPDKMIKLTVF